MFAFLILRILEFYTRNVCKAFVYKHTETIEYVQKEPSFYEKYKDYGWITRKFLELRMKNFHDIIFIWIRTYREIFKSSLV